MSTNTMITVYLGAGKEGQALYEALKKAADKEGIKISAYVKALIVKGVK